jgi:hypothetical protein
MTHIKLQILKLINNVFVLNARLIIYFLELHHTCEIYIFERVTQLAHPSALLCQSGRSYMLALEEMKKCTLEGRGYQFCFSFDIYKDI